MSDSEVMVPPVAAAGGDSFVLCEVAGATYAISSDDIEQLEMVGTITPVPNVPAFVEGITSVRGRVIPVVSLRARFGFPRAVADVRTRIVIVRMEGRSVGLMVDSAREFARVPVETIEPPPEALVDDATRYFRGIAHLGDRLVLLLDAGALLSGGQTIALPASHAAGILPAVM